MTTFARPEDYSEVDQLEPLLPDASTAVLTRIAVAVEQIALALLDRPQVVAVPQLAPLPPVVPQAPVGVIPGSLCPIHNLPWKVVPAGISSKTGQPYDSFRACSVRGCDQRPPKAVGGA